MQFHFSGKKNSPKQEVVYS